MVENELCILPELEHSNIIRAIDIGRFDIEPDEEPCPPMSFLLEPFVPKAIDVRGFAASLSYRGKEITPNLLDQSLLRLTSVLRQWVEALTYVHESGFVYLDIKPDNAIVDKDDHLTVIDLGTVQKREPDDPSPTTIFFSEPYGHPQIKKSYVRTSTDRVRTAVRRSDLTFELDYYALGKSILELLETIAAYHPHDFPQRPLFQSLHFLATRLLDGQNRKLYAGSDIWLGGKLGSPISLDEVFDGLREEDYETIKYDNLGDVLRDLDKELGFWDPEDVVPELRTFPPTTLRVVPDINTAMTQRLVSLIEHPLIARLKMVSQLGLISLVYPTGDHSRYDHILGSYTYNAFYIKALFEDSQNCMFRNLINEDDIKAGLLASIIHDLGQYPLAHDLEEVSKSIFDHSSISLDLLSDETKDRQGRTLRDIIQNTEYGWGIELDRLKRILRAHSGQVRLTEISSVRDFKADMLSALIDGPIDADKADYIIRDSIGCRIPYGKQLDIERLLSVLTTARIPAHFGAPHKVTIGIYEKGIASASAFSLARYLLYASVYWHHTCRIIKAMLHYAVVMMLPREVFARPPDQGRVTEIRANLLRFITSYLIPPADQLQQETKPRFPLEEARQRVKAKPEEDVLRGLIEVERESLIRWYPGICRTDWQMLNWLKGLARSEQSERGVALIDLVMGRQLYKRVYTIYYDGETMQYEKAFIDKLRELTWLERVRLCERIQELVYEKLREREQTAETRLQPPSDRVHEIFSRNLAILIDIPDYEKFASDRPLICVPELQSKTYYRESPAESYNLDYALNSLMKLVSPIRVICHPELRQWIGACIAQEEMRYIVRYALDKVR